MRKNNARKENNTANDIRCKRLLYATVVVLLLTISCIIVNDLDDSVAETESLDKTITLDHYVEITEGGNYTIVMPDGKTKVEYSIFINVTDDKPVNIKITGLNIDLTKSVNGTPIVQNEVYTQIYYNMVKIPDSNGTLVTTNFTDGFDYRYLPSPIAIRSGNVNLTFEGNNILQAGTIGKTLVESNNIKISGAGIWVGPNSDVTINGSMGSKLECHAAKSSESSLTGWTNNRYAGSGIGACGYWFTNATSIDFQKMGHLTIQSGTIESYGYANYAAGIGGGNGGDQTLLIEGGDIYAQGSAIGIGTGFRGSNLKIMITGGSTTAKSTGEGAGIGTSGAANADGSRGVNLTITGGKVIATGINTTNTKSVGIGIPDGSGPINVNISGGEVFAYGATGIGSGVTSETSKLKLNINISGGKVTAIGEKYSAIGVGTINNLDRYPSYEYGYRDYPNGSTISITGGDIYVSSKVDGVEAPKITLPSGESTVTLMGLGAHNNVSNGVNMGILKDILELKTLGCVNSLVDGSYIIEIDGKQTEGLRIHVLDDFTYSGVVNKELVFEMGSKTSYFGFLEGCYKYKDAEGNDVVELRYIDNNVKTETDSVIKMLNDGPSVEGIEALIGFVKEVNGKLESLTQSQRTYIKLTAQHDIDYYQNMIDKAEFDVTINLVDQEGKAPRSMTIAYNGTNIDLGIPEKSLFKFDGWSWNATKITESDGILEGPCKFLGGETLEATWITAVEGDGTKDKPYVITGVEQMVVLSHMSRDLNDLKYYYPAFTGYSTNWTDISSRYFLVNDDFTISTEGSKFVVGGTEKDCYYYGISSFKGVFDGNNKTITLNIDTSKESFGFFDSSCKGVELRENGKSTGLAKIDDDGEEKYISIQAGLFNSTSGSKMVIQDLTLEGTVKVVGDGSNCAVVVGSLGGGTISNVTNNAILHAGSTFNTLNVGGIVGHASGSDPIGTTNYSVIISGCTNGGTIYAGSDKLSSLTTSQGNLVVAGIIGNNWTKTLIENCTNSGDIISKHQVDLVGRHITAAGISVLNGGSLEIVNCMNTGDVKTISSYGNYASAIAHTNSSSYALNIIGCENSGKISTTQGITGIMISSRTSGFIGNTSINECFSWIGIDKKPNGTVKIGEYVASYENGKLKIPINEYTNYNSDLLIKDDDEIISGLFSFNGTETLTTAYHVVIPSYYNSKNDAFIMDDSNYYTFAEATHGDKSSLYKILVEGGKMTDDEFNTWETIYTLESLQRMIQNAYIIIDSDINLTTTSGVGIGTSFIPFGGTIEVREGYDYSIRYSINDHKVDSKGSSIGFVAYSKGSSITGLNVSGTISIESDRNQSKYYIGSIIGYGKDTSINDCNVYVTINTNHRIADNIINATAGGLYVGGIAGYLSNSSSGSINNCNVNTTITSTSNKELYVGGVVGTYTGMMENTIATVVLSGEIVNLVDGQVRYGEYLYMGGLVGTGQIDIDGCGAIGSIGFKRDPTSGGNNDKHVAVSGLAGSVSGSPSIKNSFAIIELKDNGISNYGRVFIDYLAHWTGTTTDSFMNNWAVVTSIFTKNDGSEYEIKNTTNTPIITITNDRYACDKNVDVSKILIDSISVNGFNLNDGVVSFSGKTDGTISFLYKGVTIKTIFITVEHYMVDSEDILPSYIEDGKESVKKCLDCDHFTFETTTSKITKQDMIDSFNGIDEYNPTGDASINETGIQLSYNGSYTGTDVMNDLARFLGVMNGKGNLDKITYRGVDYTWNAGNGLKGSNWVDLSNGTLVSAIVSEFRTNPMTSVELTLANNSTFTITFDAKFVAVVGDLSSDGTVTYSTLEAAVAAAGSDKKITLLDNVNCVPGLIVKNVYLNNMTLTHSGSATYAWSADNSSCTASMTCSVCGDSQTETVNSAVKTVDSTCSEVGSTTYTATFTNTAFSEQTNVVEIAKKTHTLVQTPYKAPTYNSTGNNEYWTCSVCGKVFKSDKTTETTIQAETIPKLTRPTTPDTPRPPVDPKPEEPVIPTLPDKEDGYYPNEDGSSTTITTDNDGNKTVVNEKPIENGKEKEEQRFDKEGNFQGSTVITNTEQTKDNGDKVTTESIEIKNDIGSTTSKVISTESVSEDGSIRTVTKTEEDGAGNTSSQTDTTITITLDTEDRKVDDGKVMDAIAQMNGSSTETSDKTLTIAAETRKGEVSTVTVSSESMKAISDAGAQVKMGNDTMTIDMSDRVVENLSGKGGDISISIGLADRTQLNEQQLKKVGDNVVLSVSATVGEESVHQLGGNVTVTLPYELKEGENPNSVKVYYVDDDGKVTLMVSKYDETTKTVSFETTHFSYYMVGGEPAEDVEDNDDTDGSGTDMTMIAGIAVTIIAIICVGAFVMHRRH